MIFFMSSEFDGRFDDFEEPFRIVQNDIEEKIKANLENNDYEKDVEDFGIIPIIMKFGDEMDGEVWYKERLLFKKKKKEADIRLRIDYDTFVKGDNQTKKLLLIDNIIKSIEALSKKTKDFKAEELISDILSLFDLKREDLINSQAE